MRRQQQTSSVCSEQEYSCFSKQQSSPQQHSSGMLHSNGDESPEAVCSSLQRHDRLARPTFSRLASDSSDASHGTIAPSAHKVCDDQDQGDAPCNGHAHPLKSSYRGVSYDKKKRKWRVQIKVASLGKSGVSVGYYSTELAAAQAYDRAAISLLGWDNESLVTNFSKKVYRHENIPDMRGQKRDEVKLSLKNERAKVQTPRRRFTRRRRTSRYQGVGASNRKNQWQARILIDGKVTHLGYYETEDLAAKVYDRVNLSLNGWGEQTMTNFPKGNYIGEDLTVYQGLRREDLQRQLGVRPMDKSSKYRGVSKKKGKWEAKVMVNRKWAYRQLFETEEEAAMAYDVAVKRLKPNEAHAYLNFPKDGQQPASECFSDAPSSDCDDTASKSCVSQPSQPYEGKDEEWYSYRPCDEVDEASNLMDDECQPSTCYSCQLAAQVNHVDQQKQMLTSPPQDSNHDQSDGKDSCGFGDDSAINSVVSWGTPDVLMASQQYLIKPDPSAFADPHNASAGLCPIIKAEYPLDTVGTHLGLHQHLSRCGSSTENSNETVYLSADELLHNLAACQNALLKEQNTSSPDARQQLGNSTPSWESMLDMHNKAASVHDFANGSTVNAVLQEDFFSPDDLVGDMMSYRSSYGSLPWGDLSLPSTILDFDLDCTTFDDFLQANADQ